MNTSLKFKISLFAILLLNIFLKFYGIEINSLWLDEAYSVNESQFSVQTIIAHSSESDNPPLYYLLLHFWTNLFGFTEIAVRSLSALSSSLASVLIFIFVSRNFNLFVGIFSALFFSFSNENLFYAQETRTYALVVLLTVVSIGSFFELNRQRKFTFLFLLTSSNILLLYSHYLSLLVPMMELGVSALFLKRNPKLFRDVFISTILVFICFLPWIHVPLSHAPKEGSFWLQSPTFSNLKGVLIGFAGNKLALIMCSIILVFVFYRKVKFIKNYKNMLSFEEVSLLTFSFFPILFVYLIAGYVPIFLMRYLLFASVSFYILFPFLLHTYSPNKKVFVFASLFLLFITTFSIKLHPTKDENWRGAVEKVKELRKNGDSIILSASYTSTIFSYYFDKNIFYRKDERNNALIKEGIFPLKIESSNGYNELMKNKRLIGVFCHELMEDPNGILNKELDKNFRISKSYDFEKVKVIEFENLMQ